MFQFCFNVILYLYNKSSVKIKDPWPGSVEDKQWTSQRCVHVSETWGGKRGPEAHSGVARLILSFAMLLRTIYNQSTYTASCNHTNHEHHSGIIPCIHI